MNTFSKLVQPNARLTVKWIHHSRRVAAQRRDTIARQRNYFARQREQVARNRTRRRASSPSVRPVQVSTDLLLLGDPRAIQAVPRARHRPPPVNSAFGNRLLRRSAALPTTVHIPISDRDLEIRPDTRPDQEELVIPVQDENEEQTFELNRDSLTNGFLTNVNDPGKRTGEQVTIGLSEGKPSSSKLSRDHFTHMDPLIHQRHISDGRRKRNAQLLPFSPPRPKVPRRRHASPQLEKNQSCSPMGSLQEREMYIPVEKNPSPHQSLQRKRSLTPERLSILAFAHNQQVIELEDRDARVRHDSSPDISKAASCEADERHSTSSLHSNDTQENSDKEGPCDGEKSSDVHFSHLEFVKQFLGCNEPCPFLIAFERKFLEEADQNVRIVPSTFGRHIQRNGPILSTPPRFASNKPHETVFVHNEAASSVNTLPPEAKEKSVTELLEQQAMSLVNAVEIKSVGSIKNPVKQAEMSSDSDSRKGSDL